MDKRRILKEYYALEYDNLCKKIGRRVFDAQDIEDVIQEAFTKALSFIDTYTGDRPFANWFGVVLSNVVKDYRTEFLNNKAGLSHNDTEEFDEDNFPTVDHSVEVDWVALDIVRREISVKERQTGAVLDLYFIHNFAPADIRFLVEDHTLHSVKKTIHRFKNDMRSKYA